MNPARALTAAVVVPLVQTAFAAAPIEGFVTSPTTNSADFLSQVNNYGADVRVVDFDTHPLGPLQTNPEPGVTFTVLGTIDGVVFGVGPGDSDGSTAPLSPGEGPNTASRYIQTKANHISSITILFDRGVYGAGVEIIDEFNPAGLGCGGVTLDALGPEGQTLESFSAAEFNFQSDNIYFMGAASADAGIHGLRLTQTGACDDAIGFDNLVIASRPGGPQTLIDFQSQRVSGDTVKAVGMTYAEDGYVLEHNGELPFLAFGLAEPRYPGSTALFNDNDGSVTTLRRADGGTFRVARVDLAVLNNPGDIAPVVFKGVLPSGTAVTQSFTVVSAGPIELQRFEFGPEFAEVQRLEWPQLSAYHQFDNIAVDEPVRAASPVCVIDVNEDGRNDILDLLDFIAMLGVGCP